MYVMKKRNIYAKINFANQTLHKTNIKHENRIILLLSTHDDWYAWVYVNKIYNTSKLTV